MVERADRGLVRFQTNRPQDVGRFLGDLVRGLPKTRAALGAGREAKRTLLGQLQTYEDNHSLGEIPPDVTVQKGKSSGTATLTAEGAARAIAGKAAADVLWAKLDQITGPKMKPQG